MNEVNDRMKIKDEILPIQWGSAKKNLSELFTTIFSVLEDNIRRIAQIPTSKFNLTFSDSNVSISPHTACTQKH